MVKPGGRSRFIIGSRAFRCSSKRGAARSRSDVAAFATVIWIADARLACGDNEAWQHLKEPEPQQAGWPRRGDIYLTALDPTVGREIQKTRPALIIQNDVSNRLTDLTIVAPITSTVRFPLNPVHVLIPADRNTGLAVTSVALLEPDPSGR